MASTRMINRKNCAAVLLLLTLMASMSGYAYSAVTSSIYIQNTGTIVRAVNAASGSAADIQAAVNVLAASGGNVYIPSGTYAWSATDSVTLPGGVNLFGASPAGCQGHENNWTSNTASTILHKNAAIFNGGMLTINGANGKPSRVSGIQFEANPVNGGSDSDNNQGRGITISGMIDYRIDHCTFKNFIEIAVWVGSTNSITSRGVLDHNLVDNPYKLSGGPYYWGYGFYNGNDFFNIADWNTNVANFAGKYAGMPARTTVMFVEDNHFIRCRHSTDGISGGWGVIRYNLMDTSIPPYGDADSHGSAAWISARGFEVYSNTFIEFSGTSDNGYGNGDIAVRLRDGSGMIFNNTFTVTPSNTGNAYFIYLDNDDSYYGTYPVTEVSQTYIWSNTYTGSSLLNNRGGYTQNTDYFLRAPTQTQDGFTYIPYVYPHPLTTQS